MPERVRIVTFAWGERYISDLLNTSLPSLLAPGNLPFMTRELDCDVVLVSQESQFERIAAHPAYRRLAALCPTRLVSLDDLIVGPWYGMSLTFALHRGIVDLGPAMTETFCVFFNADYILADGALRSVVARIKVGERLIVAPAYCAITETVAPILRQRRDDARMELSIPARELATLALRHRHYTVRAKTANQQVFRINNHDQFYWHVDDDTLLARQMPIAVMAMRPVKYLPEMETFWDYGLVSEACPGVIPSVIADSDEFMMLELRDEKTYTDLISLGWPSVQEIADHLSSFTTKDHRDYGRHTLVLHAADRPAEFAAEMARFDAFMDALYARLSPTPVKHMGHPYWTDSIDEFKRLSAAYKARRAAGVPPPDSAAATTARPEPAVPARLPTHARLHAVAQGIYARVIGRLPVVTRNHPYWTDLHGAVDAFRDTMSRPDARVLIVRSQDTLLSRLVDGTRVHEEQTGLRDQLFVATSGGESQRTELTTLAGLRVTVDAAAGAAGGSLILRAERPMHVHVAAETGVNSSLRANALMIHLGDGAEDERGTHARYDLCLCDLSYEEFANFRQIYSAIRPRMKTGGRVLALLLNRDYRRFEAKDHLLIKSAFPPTDHSRVRFQGSGWTRLIRRLFDRGVLLTGSLGLGGRLASPLLLGLSCLLAAVVNRVRGDRDGVRFRATASSLALDITVARPAEQPGRSG